MAAVKNKVKFGLRNCHYAVATMDDSQNVTFEKPVQIPGAVSLSLSAEGDNDPFYADDSVYFLVATNTGYSGDLEVAMIPESFLKDVLKETEDANGVIVENKDAEPAHFALLFEFTGDKKQIRHCMYYCSATRPAMEGDTKEDKTNVKTEKISITRLVQGGLHAFYDAGIYGDRDRRIRIRAVVAESISCCSRFFGNGR